MKISKTLSKFRHFAESHKDFLEVVFLLIGTGSAILLGWMALTVSTKANEIAATQTAIAERQTKLQEAAIQPQFRLELKDSEIVKGQELRIWNDGNPVRNYDVRQLSFIRVFYIGADQTQPNACKLIPCFFFRDRLSTQKTTGLMVTLYTADTGVTTGRRGGADSSEALKTLIAGLPQYHDSPQRLTPGSLGMEWVGYIELSYEDLAGTRRSVIFHVNPFYGWNDRRPRPLGAKAKQYVIATWGKAPYGLSSLPYPETLNVKDILEHWDLYPPCSSPY